MATEERKEKMSNFYKRFNQIMEQGKPLSLKEMVNIMREPERIVKTVITRQCNTGKLKKTKKNGIEYYQLRKERNNKQITTCPHCGLSSNDPERIRQHIRDTHKK